MLAAEGARVAICGRDPERVESARDKADAALGIVADLADADAPARLVADAQATLGRVDCLVNNVGEAYQASFDELSDEQWDALWQLNVMSYIRCIRAVLPGMRDGGGVIVNVSSTAGKRPSTGMPNYSVTKAAVLSVSRLVADLYAKDGIRCNAVTPGPTATDAWLGEGGLADQQSRAGRDCVGDRVSLLRARRVCDGSRVERGRRHRADHRLRHGPQQLVDPLARARHASVSHPCGSRRYRDHPASRPGWVGVWDGKATCREVSRPQGTRRRGATPGSAEQASTLGRVPELAGKVADRFEERVREHEERSLSPLAVRSYETRGRLRDEEECRLRTPFQRDRDRILHSKPFRRLKGKTQVFIDPAGDHYRTRMTHTLETTAIARGVARALRLNEDLTEAIGLGHDMGHPPFGHAGEDALDAALASRFGRRFRHNAQSLRIARSLNLTAEVCDGILTHTGPDEPETLEGRLVRLVDRVAYINHDIDDAIRFGTLAAEDLPRREVELLGETGSRRIDTLVQDLVETSEREGGVAQSEEIRNP